MTNIVEKLIVVPNETASQHGQVRVGDHLFPCTLGRCGVRVKKQEGDGATPAGDFALRHVLYRADRIARPKTALSAKTIDKNDGWCYDPNNAYYNRAIKLPYPASAEKMWRTDHRYDLVIVVGHNDDPVVPGAGSAIFMHLTEEDGGPTAGCIAVSLPNMLEILKVVGPDSVVEIRAEPA